MKSTRTAPPTERAGDGVELRQAEGRVREVASF
jgi:hypothetical protein